jgi:sugar transferase (PEP-CTERM/EpsH1 system associated)
MSLTSQPVTSTRDHSGAPLIAHIIFRLDVGGLENGLLNLINRIPAERYRHAIICLTDYSAFGNRLQRRDVAVYALNKPPGNNPITHFRLWRLLRQLRPDIVHTRNLAALEGAVPAFLARVPVRIHGEHGRDVGDLDGEHLGYQRLRRFFKPFVHHYVAVSKDLESYLHNRIRVRRSRVTQFYNGVDTELFRPANGERQALPLAGFASPDAFVVGTVGRMQAVKDQLTLARAFIEALRIMPEAAHRLRLVMVGDGPLREEVAAMLEHANVAKLTWLAGARDDVPALMRGMDLFVLPSLGEGVSNTILEAMASGLPVVATAVGGNSELVQEGETGQLVPRADPQAMAQAILHYFQNAEEGRRHGGRAREIAEHSYSIANMVDGYVDLYDRMLEGSRR